MAKLIKGVNDLATVNPELAKEWDYDKNGSLTPDMVTQYSNKKVWWECSKGHEWQSSISNRSSGKGCPICAGQQVLAGYNDLAAINPNLANEWNYERNENLKPNMVTANSGMVVWWKCEYGHEWQAAIYSRSSGVGCPICAKELQTSFPEQAIYFYIKKLFPDAINADNHLGKELDIYIPSEKLAIEYDGVQWHKNIRLDKEKNRLCETNKITLYRFRESGLPLLDESEYLKIIPCEYRGKDIERAINILLEHLQTKIDVNISRDRTQIYASYVDRKKEESLLAVNPKLAMEWNYEKNGSLKPDMVTPNSGKKVWWKCSRGHEWQAIIDNRCKGIGCPICSGRQALKGYNDLVTVNPNLAKQWNDEKNSDLKADMVTPNSHRTVWWKCSKGHEWKAVISNRTLGRGCPICANKQVLKGYNDLETMNPELAQEWNYKKNENLKPNMVTANSGKRVWWKCSRGHEWQAVINHRSKGSGCPFCSGRQAVVGETDLLSINPNLAKEWNYERNGVLKPDMFTPNSGKKVWWKCNQGHEWQASISNRNKGSGCPYCSGRQAIKGNNDLKTVNPVVAKEWNYEKNNGLTPDMFLPWSEKKVWWKCSKCGYEWGASISNRNKGTGCPQCYKTRKEKHG